MKPNRNRTRDLGFYLVMMVIFIAIILSFTKDTQSQELKYSDLVELFTEERVQSFEVKGNQITMKIRTDKADSAKADSAKTDSADGDTASSVVDSLLGSTAASSDGTKLVRCKVYDFSVFYSDFHDLIWQQKVDGIIEEYNYTEGSAGMKEKYLQTYGMQYQIVSNKNDELMQLFHHTCEKNGIVHDNRKIFEYLSTFETKCDNVQLSLFDKDFAGKSPNGI